MKFITDILQKMFKRSYEDLVGTTSFAPSKKSKTVFSNIQAHVGNLTSRTHPQENSNYTVIPEYVEI